MIMYTDGTQPAYAHSWYLVRCIPHKEMFTARVLKMLLGMETYLPECQMKLRGAIRQVPFFPGYVFIQADLSQVSSSQINSCPGVIHLVAFDNEPCSVPSSVIKEITTRLLTLGVLNIPSFCAGDQVRVKHDGPLQGLEMVFVRSLSPSQRAAVLLSFLGRQKEVYVDIALLERTPGDHGKNAMAPQLLQIDSTFSSIPKKSIRYTRGKGRKIKYSV